MENKQNYTALYLPALEEGEQNPSKSGFKTPELADKYIRKHQCKGCKKLTANYLKWQKNGCKPTLDDFCDEKIKDVKNYNKMTKNEKFDLENDIHLEFENLYGTYTTSCSAEWLIIETEHLEECNNFGDIMEAVGAEKIWKKEEKGEENVNRKD